MQLLSKHTFVDFKDYFHFIDFEDWNLARKVWYAFDLEMQYKCYKLKNPIVRPLGTPRADPLKIGSIRQIIWG